VKPVALDPFCSQRVGNRQHACDVRHMCMKARVETRDLRQAGKMCRGKSDDRQSRWHVQWGKGYGRVELIEDRLIDDAVVLELRAAVHDTMPDALRCGHFQVGQQPGYADNRVLLAGQRSALAEQRGPYPVFGVEDGRLLADRLRLAGDQPLGVLGANLRDEEPLFSASTCSSRWAFT
jgi:hypothetical protein